MLVGAACMEQTCRSLPPSLSSARSPVRSAEVNAVSFLSTWKRTQEALFKALFLLLWE